MRYLLLSVSILAAILGTLGFRFLSSTKEAATCGTAATTCQPANHDLALVSNTPVTLTAEGAPTCRSAGILLSSSDMGDTWSDLSGPLTDTLQVLALHAQAGEVLLGTRHQGLLRSSSPETGKWALEYNTHDQMYAIGVPPNLGGVTAVYPGAKYIYLATDYKGLFRLTPGQALWEPIHLQLPDQRIHQFVETPTGALLVGTSSGIYRSTNGGKGWAQVLKTVGMEVLHSGGGVLLANDFEGVLSSEDDGQTWVRGLADKGGVYRFTALSGSVAAVRVASRWKSSTPYDGEKLLHSADGGKSWRKLEAFTLPAQDVQDFVPFGDYLYCNHTQGISRSHDGGKTWQLILATRKEDRFAGYQLATDGKMLYAVRGQNGC